MFGINGKSSANYHSPKRIPTSYTLTRIVNPSVKSKALLEISSSWTAPGSKLIRSSTVSPPWGTKNSSVSRGMNQSSGDTTTTARRRWVQQRQWCISSENTNVGRANKNRSLPLMDLWLCMPLACRWSAPQSTNPDACTVYSSHECKYGWMVVGLLGTSFKIAEESTI